jgi:hypothetical protein
MDIASGGSNMSHGAASGTILEIGGWIIRRFGIVLREGSDAERGRKRRMATASRRENASLRTSTRNHE